MGGHEWAAWCWLLSLPRFDWQTTSGTRMRRQIELRVEPGELRAASGAPMVRVSVAHPAIRGRVVGEGNSLYEAVEAVERALWRRGVRHEPLLAVRAMVRP